MKTGAFIILVFVSVIMLMIEQSQPVVTQLKQTPLSWSSTPPPSSSYWDNLLQDGWECPCSKSSFTIQDLTDVTRYRIGMHPLCLFAAGNPPFTLVQLLQNFTAANPQYTLDKSIPIDVNNAALTSICQYFTGILDTSLTQVHPH